jgi:hypothetical protein
MTTEPLPPTLSKPRAGDKLLKLQCVSKRKKTIKLSSLPTVPTVKPSLQMTHFNVTRLHIELLNFNVRIIFSRRKCQMLVVLLPSKVKMAIVHMFKIKLV